jgi:Phosphohistidine swiveling domain
MGLTKGINKLNKNETPITKLSDETGYFPAQLSLGSIENYQQLFQVGTMPYLISDIFAGHYQSLGCLLISLKNNWTSFLPKSVIGETLNTGVEIIGSKNKFNSYKKEFNEYKVSSSDFFNKIVKKENILKGEVDIFFKNAIGLFVYYSKTEFFYTDKAFLESSGSSVIKNNLHAMEEIKNSGREYLNKIFFGSDSYLNQLLVILGKQFSIDHKVLMQYSRQEILSLFDNEIVAKASINNRLKSYLMFGVKNNFVAIDGDKAEEIIASFFNSPNKEITEIKGTVANSGIVKGNVKVIFLDYNNFDQLKYEIKTMKQGAILVAETTSPELVIACHKAGAIITNQGGLMSHAAIISRELNIPCIVGTGNATKILKDGDLVEVDANIGIIKIIKKINNHQGPV